MVAKLSKFGKKRNSFIENVVASIVFVGIFGGLIGFFVYQNITIGQKRSDLEGRMSELQAQVSELSNQRDQLQENIADTQTEEYQEKVLREQGLYKKEGEQVITVLPPAITFEEVVESEEKQSTWWKPWTW